MEGNFIIIDLSSVDPDKTLRAIINELLTRNKTADQQKLPSDEKQEEKTSDNKNRKYFCNNPDCKKEVEKEVVAFCLFKDQYGRTRFNGKVYCRGCQENK